MKKLFRAEICKVSPTKTSRMTTETTMTTTTTSNTTMKTVMTTQRASAVRTKTKFAESDNAKDEQRLQTRKRLNNLLRRGTKAGRTIAHRSKKSRQVNINITVHMLPDEIPNRLWTYNRPSGYENCKATPPRYHIAALQYQEDCSTRRPHPPQQVQPTVH